MTSDGSSPHVRAVRLSSDTSLVLVVPIVNLLVTDHASAALTDDTRQRLDVLHG